MEDDVPEGFSVISDAFAATTGLPLPAPPPGVVNPLGMERMDWFVYNVLQSAGIMVEKVKLGEDEMLYQWAQIVHEMDFDRAMKVDNMQDIKYLEGDKMMGLQVKLNGAHHWKVKMATENLDTHRPERRESRGSSSACSIRRVPEHIVEPVALR